jgi:molybdate transport system regulatory protein
MSWKLASSAWRPSSRELEVFWAVPYDGAMTRTRLRVYLGSGHSLGPGKIRLLEAVQEYGSISAAARSMGMAYRHAWELLNDMNCCFAQPVTESSQGGRAGGGAKVTPFGEEVIRRFQNMERKARKAMADDLAALEAEVVD